MSLVWKLRRLMAMSPGEVAYRAGQGFRGKLEKTRLGAISSTPPESLLCDAFRLPADSGEPFDKRLLEHLRKRESPRFFFDFRERDAIAALFRERYPNGVEATRETAESLLGRRFALFGREISLGEPIDWSKDHLTGRSWPKKYAREIDIRDTETVGGIKYAWEPSRHLHWMTLARAYFLTGEEKYARELCAQWESWLDDNPPLIGIHWTSALEMAIRVFVWSWCLHFLLPWEGLDSRLVARAMGSMLLQLRFIPGNFSRFSSANNHLVGEASGLAFAGILFPEFREAESWRTVGLRILDDEIAKQVHPDGVSAEQATHYQTFILDLYLQSYLAAANNRTDAGPGLAPFLERMMEFLAHILDAGGYLPIIGDADDGQAVRLTDEGEGDAQSLLATGAALFERPDFAGRGGGFDEKSWWLLGEPGRERFRKLPAQAGPHGSVAFPSGGYYVMRDGQGATERMLIADCGPLGYGALAAHGHADALSFVLSLGGHPILVDPGNFCYHESPEWRSYFRSTGAHNTVLVDGLDQSQMRGPFLWGARAQARELRWETNTAYDYLYGRHDGYLRPPTMVEHQRRILYVRPDIWVVVDSLEGSGDHRWERRFHFSPGEVEIDPANRTAVAVRGGRKLTLQWLDDEKADLAIGREDPIAGWYSPSYGVKVPACSLVLAGEGGIPARGVTVLSAGEVPSVTRLSDTKDELSLALELGDRRVEVVFDAAGGVRVTG